MAAVENLDIEDMGLHVRAQIEHDGLVRFNMMTEPAHHENAIEVEFGTQEFKRFVKMLLRLDETLSNRRWYIHKHEVAMQYGGSEEGGWWFDVGSPVEDWDPDLFEYGDEEEAYENCRELNEGEYKRREKEEDYEYTSVLAYRSTHYSYTVSDSPIPFSYPEGRPHYE